MSMGGEDNACSLGLGLWATMGLGKLEEVFDFMSSQLNRRQEGMTTHGAPPSLVGKRSHRTRLSLFTTHQPMSPIPVSTARHSHLPFLRAWHEFAPACTQYLNHLTACSSGGGA